MRKGQAFVLDTGAVLSLARPGDYAGASVAQAAVSDPDKACYAHGITLHETYAVAMRPEIKRTEARALLQGVLAAGVVPREDMDVEFWQSAGDLRSSYNLSTGDSFCVALALRVGGTVLTADRKDFGPVARAKVCRVKSIG